jgi:hypothetical protein
MDKVAVCDPFLGGNKWLSATDVIAALGDLSSPSLKNAKLMTQPTGTNMATLDEAVKPELIF